MTKEVPLRGYQLSRPSRKLNVVVVAARYAPRSKKLLWVQAYQRRGPIWGDLVILDREGLMGRLQRKLRVVTGAPASIPGEFNVHQEVKLQADGGSIYAGSPPEKGDDLAVPLV